MPGKMLKSQAQELVLNLCEYFEMENFILESCSSKISRKTAYAIRKKKENNPSFLLQKKSKTRSKPKTTDLPDGSKMAIRNTIYEMCKERKPVTLHTLNCEIKSKEIVRCSTTSFSTLLKEIGFKFKKDDNRRVLIEPCTSTKKVEIASWLRENEITFNPKMTKSELLQVVKMHRKENVYIIDEIIREHGHEVLRLPPYHCDFNAIELIWANCKSYYNKHIGRDGSSDEKVLEMCNEALEQCTPNMWAKCVDHTEALIRKWYDREKVMCDIEVEPLTINVGDSSSSESDDD